MEYWYNCCTDPKLNKEEQECVNACLYDIGPMDKDDVIQRKKKKGIIDNPFRCTGICYLTEETIKKIVQADKNKKHW